ncbi:MAG: alpha/beta hydrolase [Okeania sp. SIO2C2]|uniref:alpha/beta hydrolase n=1 Tax=Okeania sp. SIO2C2 TaxID=2607787 RepID=UPI0013B6D535|nr:alpha/beta hydrolase fold domain-containing protein [Okeania sp. SIO2C2]NEP91344.1 alpha/beta hydrolase [Okeania sp. SIO2C2]
MSVTNKFTAWFALIYLCCLSMLFQAPALAESLSMLDYKVTPEVIYGEGEITQNGKSFFRDLWMDFYEPLAETKKPRRAIIFTHGGSFHRGDPRRTYDEDGAQDTSPGDYCRKFATRGYVCFAITYRLAPEGPIPSGEGYTEDDLDRNSVTIMFDQVNKIRNNMGLDPLDPSAPEDIELMSDAVLSAAEDLRTALNHIRKFSRKYNIDPEHIVLGGFSAGAITTLNVAHGMHEPVAGAFLLSGGNVGFDILQTVTPSSDNPPILLFQGQNDLNAFFVAIPILIEHYQEVGVNYKFAWVPAFGHFYASGVTSLSGDGSKMSVEERIVQFLEETWTGS